MTVSWPKSASTARAQDVVENAQAKLRLSLLRELTSEQTASVLTQVKRVEKHTFPANEAMHFTPELLTKPNTSTLLLLLNGDLDCLQVVGYVVFVRWQRRVLLHKICVHSKYRNQGNGSRLMADVIARAQKASCSQIELWVDQARTSAMKLYTTFGFEEVDRVENYYAVNRTGIKMLLKLDV